MSPMRVARVLLGAVVLAMAGGALLTASTTSEFGAGTLGRALLGMVGVVGAVMLWSDHPLWFPVLAAWSALQIPLLIVDPTGPLTNQCVHVGMAWTRAQRINGRITAASGYGFNLAGAALLAWAVLVRRAAPGRTVAVR